MVENKCMKHCLNIKQQLRAINNSTHDTRLSISERKLYQWLNTQLRHKNLRTYNNSWRDWKLCVFKKNK